MDLIIAGTQLEREKLVRSVGFQIVGECGTVFDDTELQTMAGIIADGCEKIAVGGSGGIHQKRPSAVGNRGLLRPDGRSAVGRG